MILIFPDLTSRKDAEHLGIIDISEVVLDSSTLGIPKGL